MKSIFTRKKENGKKENSLGVYREFYHLCNWLLDCDDPLTLSETFMTFRYI